MKRGQAIGPNKVSSKLTTGAAKRYVSRLLFLYSCCCLFFLSIFFFSAYPSTLQGGWNRWTFGPSTETGRGEWDKTDIGISRTLRSFWLLIVSSFFFGTFNSSLLVLLEAKNKVNLVSCCCFICCFVFFLSLFFFSATSDKVGRGKTRWDVAVQGCRVRCGAWQKKLSSWNKILCVKIPHL